MTFGSLNLRKLFLKISHIGWQFFSPYLLPRSLSELLANFSEDFLVPKAPKMLINSISRTWD